MPHSAANAPESGSASQNDSVVCTTSTVPGPGMRATKPSVAKGCQNEDHSGCNWNDDSTP